MTFSMFNVFSFISGLSRFLFVNSKNLLHPLNLLMKKEHVHV